MAKSINQVILMGNLTKEPDMQQTPAGQNVVRFSLALDRTYISNGEKMNAVDYVDCVAWGDLAMQVKLNLNKGSRCLVEGRITTRSWDDKETGVRRYKTEVLAEDVTFLWDGVQGGDDGSNQSNS